eukprot:jgi/Ulvmu1/11405/UM075_0067.1
MPRALSSGGCLPRISVVSPTRPVPCVRRLPRPLAEGRSLCEHGMCMSRPSGGGRAGRGVDQHPELHPELHPGLFPEYQKSAEHAPAEPVAAAASVATEASPEGQTAVAEKPKAAASKKAKPVDLGAWPEIKALLKDPSKVMIISTAPSVRVTVPEALGLPRDAPQQNWEQELYTALRRLGFPIVFDTNFAADLTIMEEGTELLHRIKDKLLNPEEAQKHPMPMFTSCCPGWIQLAEKSFPEILPHVSTCKSPQGMLGSLIKTYFAQQAQRRPEEIVYVSVMPCVRKQGEADRDLPESHSASPDDGQVRDVDYVLTAVQMAAVLRAEGVDLFALPKGSVDDPLGISGGAGALFGTTGGVMEAAVRTVYELVVGEPLGQLVLDGVRGFDTLKLMTLELTPSPDGALGPALAEAGVTGPIPVRIGVVNGLGEAKKVVRAVEAGELEVDFIEVMACPGGCIGGAGNPRAEPGRLQERQQAMYAIDEARHIRRSHENPAVRELYRRFLGEPNSHLAHELLHTHYVPGAPAAVVKPKATIPAE